jgi:thiol-disulfide isomerase/thioredoxin
VDPPVGRTVAGGRLVKAAASILGGLLVASAAIVGGLDLHRGVGDWSQLGPLPPGRTVDDFRVVMLDGSVLTAERLQGKVSVVTFWATWCGVCKGELSDLDELDATYADERVQFIAVNREGGGVSLAQARVMAQRYRQARQLDLPVALDDGTMARIFRVGPIPHTVVFDRAGTMRHIHQGRVASATLAAEIDALLSE